MELRENYDAWAAMLAESFGEDASIRVQMRDVERADALFLTQCRGMLRAYDRVGGVIAWGDCEGVALGAFSQDEARLGQYLQEELSSLAQTASPESLAAVQRNSASITAAARPDWYRSALGTQDVYTLQAIAVRRDRRGTGVFRHLMTPVLEAARQRRVPVVLQTFEPENRRKYEHMGFRTVEEIPVSAAGLICYNMVCP